MSKRVLGRTGRDDRRRQKRAVHVLPKPGVPEKVGAFTVIVPFYRNVGMLKVQLEACTKAPEGVRFIFVDDGSPEPAEPIICQYHDYIHDVRLYRILEDIPWNRGGARNLGAHEAGTRWIVQVDIDHVLQPQSYAPLMDFMADPVRFYRFPRWRVGQADETRRKDKIPRDSEFGRIHEHVDSYLITKELYWQSGGYNEVFSGCLGGGGAFLRRLEKRFSGPALLTPDSIRTHVYTRSVVQDSSDWVLSRDPAEYGKRKRQFGEMSDPIPPLNFKWERVL